MANLKISQLPSVVIPTINDFMVVVNDGITKKMTIDDLKGIISFTGNTSGDCISDIYVSTIHSCSPLTIDAEFTEFFSEGVKLATFTVADGLKMEDNVSLKLGAGSTIVNEAGTPIVKEDGSNEQAKSGPYGNGLVLDGFVGDSLTFKKEFTGTTSGGTIFRHRENLDPGELDLYSAERSYGFGPYGSPYHDYKIIDSFNTNPNIHEYQRTISGTSTGSTFAFREMLGNEAISGVVFREREMLDPGDLVGVVFREREMLDPGELDVFRVREMLDPGKLDLYSSERFAQDLTYTTILSGSSTGLTATTKFETSYDIESGLKSDIVYRVVGDMSNPLYQSRFGTGLSLKPCKLCITDDDCGSYGSCLESNGKLCCGISGAANIDSFYNDLLDGNMYTLNTTSNDGEYISEIGLESLSGSSTGFTGTTSFRKSYNPLNGNFVTEAISDDDGSTLYSHSIAGGCINRSCTSDSDCTLSPRIISTCENGCCTPASWIENSVFTIDGGSSVSSIKQGIFDGIHESYGREDDTGYININTYDFASGSYANTIKNYIGDEYTKYTTLSTSNMGVADLTVTETITGNTTGATSVSKFNNIYDLFNTKYKTEAVASNGDYISTEENYDTEFLVYSNTMRGESNTFTDAITSVIDETADLVEGIVSTVYKLSNDKTNSQISYGRKSLSNTFNDFIIPIGSTDWIDTLDGLAVKYPVFTNSDVEVGSSVNGSKASYEINGLFGSGIKYDIKAVSDSANVFAEYYNVNTGAEINYFGTDTEFLQLNNRFVLDPSIYAGDYVYRSVVSGGTTGATGTTKFTTLQNITDGTYKQQLNDTTKFELADSYASFTVPVYTNTGIYGFGAAASGIPSSPSDSIPGVANYEMRVDANGSLYIYLPLLGGIWAKIAATTSW
jgi:hypothetical protein